MLSLNARLLVAASLVLAAFLGLTGLTLDRAFRNSALAAVQERLQTQIYALLAAAELGSSSQLTLPETLPEARFSTPGSGLYAQVVRDDGVLIWRSHSMLGVNIPFPLVEAPGVPEFLEANASDRSPVFVLGFAVDWELDQKALRRYSFFVAESRDAFDAQVGRFRRSLWGWLMAAALVLLAVQGAILRWGLAPLRQVAREINEIESGHRAQLEATYPRELRSLTTNLNALIESSNRHLKRYRNALGDLAHSLKTPLAVMQSTIETEASTEELRGTFSEQLERLRRTVEYQLQRAVASGRTALMAPISVQSVAEKLVETFQKVYAETPKSFELWLDGAVQFYGDEGDLMEILGNLIDNACKCSRQRVRISGYVMPERSARRSAVVLAVEDDGPGIPVEKRAAVLERGVRGESGSAGQGIGLAVVRDLVVDVYGGSLNFETSSLGGARVEAMIQF